MPETVKVTLKSTYNYHDGQSYGPGEVEVPANLATALGLKPEKAAAKREQEKKPEEKKEG